MNIIYNLPILYILSNNKKRFWNIWIEEDKNTKNIYICRKYGIIDGKITIPNKKLVPSLNKAITLINALWRKKKEAGFQEKLDTNIKNKHHMIKPMSAYKLDEHFHKIKYPALVQRKLDGFRCLSNVKNNESFLYSKNMKSFIFLNHIKKEILKIKELTNQNIYLDGELYEFGLKLHEISSMVMKKYATNKEELEMKKISYYIFDIFDINNLNIPFEIRYKKLENIFKKYDFKYLKLVTCTDVNSYEDIKKLDIQYLYEGYEGVIVRNKDGIYKLNSKSYDVLRTKEFKKKNFMIMGAKEGSGTQKGAVIWQLKCSNKSFFAIPIGNISNRINIYNEFKKNPDNFIGKYARIKFLEIDNNGCITRNPILEEIL
jgi:ATP-dependent DNA ligase